ncbi:MAG: hypothetical protein M1469_01140 [Bacteroidetes bacterium]|nr:hypothetical protein [Bacteroidota bacterium]
MDRVIKCACDSNNCPAQLELIPEGKFMRVKSGGVTVAVDLERAIEIILEFADHFHLDGTIFHASPLHHVLSPLGEDLGEGVKL